MTAEKWPDNARNSGSVLVFYFMLLYLPFQQYLPDTTMGGGINLLNLLLVMLLFSALLVKAPDYSRDYARFRTLIFLFMGYTLCSSLINSSRMGIIDALITWKRLYFISVLFIASYKLLQTERQIKTTMAIISLVTFTSAIQVLRNTYEFRGMHYHDGMRYGGMFGRGGENDLAAFLAINCFWFLFWSQGSRVPWKRLLFLGMAGVVGLACLFCYSRGAYLALFAGLLFYAWKRYRVLLAVLALMLVTIPAWAPQPVRERIEMLTHDEKLDKDTSAQSRLVIWEGGKRMMAANLLFGVGPSNFGAHIREYAELSPTSPTASHNMYLRMGAELGLPGLWVFLLILWHFFRGGVALAREGRGWQPTWATAYTASIIAVVIVNYFGDRFFREELTGYIWVTAAIGYRLRGMAEGTPAEDAAVTAIPATVPVSG